MEENRSIFQGEVWIEGDMVTYVGQGSETTGGNVPKWDREIDGQGNLLMPGFKNAHTHSAMTFLRSHADDMKLDDWLNKQVFPAEAKLDGEAVYWLSLIHILAMQQPPSDKGKRLKLYYITQVAVKPPTFVIFVNDKELMHFSYTRYLENKIREAFGFRGTSLKFFIRERKEKEQ